MLNLQLKSLYQLIESFPKGFPIEPPLSRKRIIEENVRMGLLETDRDGRMIYILKMGNVLYFYHNYGV